MTEHRAGILAVPFPIFPEKPAADGRPGCLRIRFEAGIKSARFYGLRRRAKRLFFSVIKSNELIL